jgi:hypothetical protein
MDNRKIEFWGEPNAENLYHSTEDDLIDEMLEGMDPPPETLTICGYARAQLQPADLDFHTPLNDILDDLDEEYGSPDDATEPTENMIKAERELINTIRKEYFVWRCDPVITKTINVKEWLDKQEFMK